MSTHNADSAIRNPQSAILLHPPFTIHHYETIGSTNDQLKQMLDAPEFTCVTADEQTAGRGRRDRSWHSAPGEGLYLSVLLRPEISAEKFPLLSLMAAVSVAEAIQTVLRDARITKVQLDIKWPNDVLANERKLSGILIESTTVKQAPPRVIVGIGVNLNQQAFPPELSKLATSLRLECGRAFETATVRNVLLTQLALWYEDLRRNRSHKILTRWQELSSYAHGKSVVVHFDHEEMRGETCGLNDSGALQLKTDSGLVHSLLIGEITHLRRQ
jgi:BirA family transcriptional regulator, biotin operon repressor / biotin---[acetyl-CoA-carboxylase] ligase